MKTFKFPYSGTGGPGDSWSGYTIVELTDEQAALLDASISSGSFDDIDEDPALDDICQKVWKSIIADTISNYDEKELREYGTKRDSLEKCAKKLLDRSCASIHYPGGWFF